MNEELFAKVTDGAVTVFPITLDEWNTTYTFDPEIVECIHGEKPPLDTTMQRYVMHPVFMRDVVFITYEVVDKTIDDLFVELNAIMPAVTIATVPPQLLNAIIVRTKERIQEMLDTFARTRDYGDMFSAISYKTSTVLEFQTEANRCEVLRDNTWNSLNIYLTDVMTAVKPLPTAWIDINTQLPALTW